MSSWLYASSAGASPYHLVVTSGDWLLFHTFDEPAEVFDLEHM
jgi:hypothetical protein